jgi:hypothetical protein
MKRETGIVSVLAIMVLLSSCGGGGSSTSSPYTGLTTAAVITDNNADEIALAAFQGGDLGANAVIPLAPAGEAAVRPPAASPTALALVRTVSQAAMTAVRPPGVAGGRRSGHRSPKAASFRTGWAGRPGTPSRAMT